MAVQHCFHSAMPAWPTGMIAMSCPAHGLYTITACRLLTRQIIHDSWSWSWADPLMGITYSNEFNHDSLGKFQSKFKLGRHQAPSALPMCSNLPRLSFVVGASFALKNCAKNCRQHWNLLAETSDTRVRYSSKQESDAFDERGLTDVPIDFGSTIHMSKDRAYSTSRFLCSAHSEEEWCYGEIRKALELCIQLFAFLQSLSLDAHHPDLLNTISELPVALSHCFPTTQPGLIWDISRAVPWDRPWKGRIFGAEPTQPELSFTWTVLPVLLGWITSQDELNVFHPGAGMGFIMLHLPFPSDLGVDIFLSIGLLKVTFWFTLRVAIWLLCRNASWLMINCKGHVPTPACVPGCLSQQWYTRWLLTPLNLTAVFLSLTS